MAATFIQADGLLLVIRWTQTTMSRSYREE